MYFGVEVGVDGFEVLLVDCCYVEDVGVVGWLVYGVFLVVGGCNNKYVEFV